MSEYLIQGETLTAIADEVRTLAGTTGTMSPDAMVSTLSTENINFNSNLSTQDDLISQIRAVVDSLPEAGSDSVELSLQDKTVTPTTNSQTVTADSGYDGLDTVTVNPIPSSYVEPTYTKSATTYTPGTTNQTIAAGTYLTGTQTIKGDTNLVPANIVSGKSIFGVSGTAEVGSGSGGGSIETCSGSLTFDAPPDSVTIYYVNSSMQLSTFTADSVTSFQPIKNSIICIQRWSSTGRSNGNAELINYYQGYASYFISGDFTLIYA